MAKDWRYKYGLLGWRKQLREQKFTKALCRKDAPGGERLANPDEMTTMVHHLGNNMNTKA